MRISTFTAFETGITSLQNRQQELQASQQQLTTGKRVAVASDDPTAAARAERAIANISRMDANQRSVDSSRNILQQSEIATVDATNLMQQAREALVAAGNGSYTATDRAVVASQLKQLRGALLEAANRPDGSAGYLFGGQGASQAPFLDSPTGVQYVGTRGAIRGSEKENMPLSVDGAAAWVEAPTGNGVFETRSGANLITGAPASTSAWIDVGSVINPSQLALTAGTVYSVQFAVVGFNTTYTVLKDGVATGVTGPYTSGQSIQVDGMAVSVSGSPADGDTFEIVPSTNSQSIFNTLDKAIAVMQSSTSTSNEVTQAIAFGLRDVDASLNRMTAVRSEIGNTLNSLDGTESRFSSQKLYSQTEQSDSVDLDMVQGISKFQNQQTGYDAALKAYSMVQRLSLFQYLNG